MRFVLLAVALLATSARADLDRLDPIFEGVYEAKFTCRSPGCAGFPSDIDRIAMLDMGKHGIFVSFHRTKAGLATIRLKAIRVDASGAHLEADALETHGMVIEWVSDIDRATGKLSAKVRDARYPGDLTVEGKRLYNTSGQYKPQPTADMLGLLDLQGRYAIDRWGSELILRQPLGGTSGLFGTWLLPSGAVVQFTDSEFFPEMGVLALYNVDRMGGLKWTVALSRTGGGLVSGEVIGCSNVNAGVCYPVKMVRTGP